MDTISPTSLSRAVAGPRTAAWDVLRGNLTLLVLFHHTAITYGAKGGWFYVDTAPNATPTSIALIVLCTIDQAFFMGLFFLLAGRFTRPALHRKGPLRFAADRLLRLGIPLLVFGFVLGPMTIALAGTARGHRFADTWQSLVAAATFDIGPSWFMLALLAFSAIAMLWAWPRRRSAAPPVQDRTPFPARQTLLAGALATGAASLLIRQWWPVGDSWMGLQFGYFASYVVLFAFGCAAGTHGWLERVPAADMRFWRRVSAWSLLALPVLAVLAPTASPDGGLSAASVVYAFWEPFFAWGVIGWLLVWFRERHAHPGPMRRSLSRCAYAIFVIHPPVLVAVALLLRPIELPPFVKFLVCGTAGSLLCWGIAAALVRVPGIRRIV